MKFYELICTSQIQAALSNRLLNEILPLNLPDLASFVLNVSKNFFTSVESRGGNFYLKNNICASWSWASEGVTQQFIERQFIEFYQIIMGVLNEHMQWNEFYQWSMQGVLNAHFSHIHLFTVHGCKLF